MINQTSQTVQTPEYNLLTSLDPNNEQERMVLIAMAMLEGNPHFSIVMQWLQAHLDQFRNNALSIRDDILLRMHQGAGQLLSDELRIIGTAREALDQAARNQSQRK